jgi:hypothetical protein
MPWEPHYPELCPKAQEPVPSGPPLKDLAFPERATRGLIAAESAE